ncbi:MAG TPA: hypothetical protein VFC51_12460 [Chloroflexota bacterium]|nr:hypothetical protein [Chloroflexota bacterium]
MAAEELSYRIRTATLEDVPVIRQAMGAALSHPEGKGRRESYRAPATRGELLVLERYDPRARDWRIAALVDWHMRVDDVLTIRDIATEGEIVHAGMVKHLITELIRSLSPVEMIVKARADAAQWNDIFRSIPGFVLEGSEYRRPNWINVWKWSRELAARATRAPAPRFRR